MPDRGNVLVALMSDVPTITLNDPAALPGQALLEEYARLTLRTWADHTEATWERLSALGTELRRRLAAWDKEKGERP